MDNAVIQTVHIYDGKVMHLPAHIEIAREAFWRLYGADADISPADVESAVDRLHPPSGMSILAIMRLEPSWDDVSADPQCKLSVELAGRLLYPGYVMWHGRLRAAKSYYHSSFSGEPCESSIIHSSYAESCARRGGADAAIHIEGGSVCGLAWCVWCCDATGATLRNGIGEWPLFFVCDGSICTPAIGFGGVDSSWRRLGIKAVDCGMGTVCERAVSEQEIGAVSEIFAVTPQGVVSIARCGDNMYFNSVAPKIAAVLPSFSRDSLL